MAFDAFLYFQSTNPKLLPKGESTDSQFMPYYAFEIKSFNFSVQNNVTISSQSMGAGAGRGVFEKFKFQKTIDRGSPTLFGACVAGKHLDAAVLVLRKAGGASRAGGLPALLPGFQVLVLLYRHCFMERKQRRRRSHRGCELRLWGHGNLLQKARREGRRSRQRDRSSANGARSPTGRI